MNRALTLTSSATANRKPATMTRFLLTDSIERVARMPTESGASIESARNDPPWITTYEKDNYAIGAIAAAEGVVQRSASFQISSAVMTRSEVMIQRAIVIWMISLPKKGSQANAQV